MQGTDRHASNSTSSHSTILVVEDDLAIREELRDLLTDAGYSIATAEEGAQAFDQLHRGAPPDLIVLDLMMPGMDGWQFRVQQLREPSLSTIPVIALSADTSAKAAAIDADAYVPKPFRSEDLLRAVDRVLLSAKKKRMETEHRERDRLTALGTLAAGLAHEINNPLAIVAGHLDLLELRCDGIGSASSLDECRIAAQAMRQSLAASREATERIAAVVSSMYTFARPETQEVSPIDVGEVLAVTLQLARGEIRARAELVQHLSEVPMVQGNPTRLGQVFLNLLMNAVQALPEGRDGHRITVSTKLQAGQVVVEVADTGRGIPPEVLGRIYDPFFTTKPMPNGTGLGLTICHSAVHSMGGSLEVESEVDKGTTFRVLLPAVRAEPRQKYTSRPPVPLDLARRRILVIDDEAPLCRLLKSLLGDRHDVSTYTDPRLALERLRAGERFDLILCDLMMPDMNGMDVHAALLEQAPDQAERIVFLTGGAFTPATQGFLKSVHNTCILKPFKIGQILKLVEHRARPIQDA